MTRVTQGLRSEFVAASMLESKMKSADVIGSQSTFATEVSCKAVNQAAFQWAWSELASDIAKQRFLRRMGQWYLPQTESRSDTKVNLRILQVNILHNNKQYAKAIARVMEVQSDIAIFLEASTSWVKELEILETCFPYHFKIKDRDNYGSGAVIYSKLPLEETSTLALAGGRKSLVSRINIEGMPVLIIATHLSNPVRKNGFEKRNKQLVTLGDYVANTKDAVIVVGDFNTTMWSPYYKRFSHQTGLRNARSGFGIMPTWPVRSPLFYIPIDHCLVSREIQIIKSRTGRAMGSDHLPLITDLAIAAKTYGAENRFSGE